MSQAIQTFLFLPCRPSPYSVVLVPLGCRVSIAVSGITSLSRAEQRGWDSTNHTGFFFIIIKKAKCSWKSQKPSPNILLAKLLRSAAALGCRGLGDQGYHD